MNHLRIIAGAIVTESKLSKGAKLQLLKFIQKEATETQLKSLLLDGKILTKIDKQTKNIINSRFENFSSRKNFSKKLEEVLVQKKSNSKK